MKSKKGISLIVLVITIVVMIILAGAIIISLNNTGIIKKANEAVEASDEAAIKELAQMGWADAYLKAPQDIKDDEYYQEAVMEYLDKQGMTEEQLGKYLIHATTKGVTIRQADKAWVQKGFTVVRGEDVLEIGDIINYDETVGETKTGLTDTAWQVLGADEAGNLLIISTNNLGIKTFGTIIAEGIDSAQEDWLKSLDLLDEVCEPYGKGTGVVGKARSVTAEDVNKVTGYNPKTAQYGKNELYEYGNEVTYEWDTTDKSNIKLKYSGTINNVAGSKTYEYDYFTWYDEKTGTFPKVAKGDTSKPLPTIASMSYYYLANELTTINKEDNLKAYSMLFGANDDKAYWLASYDINTYISATSFGVNWVEEGMVGGPALWQSDGHTSFEMSGVRAVVTLSSDIQFTGSSQAGWSYTRN